MATEMGSYSFNKPYNSMEGWDGGFTQVEDDAGYEWFYVYKRDLCVSVDINPMIDAEGKV